MIATSMRAPPIVGVPSLTRWVLGPQSRTACPKCMARSRRIIQGPAAKPMKSAVSAAMSARSVR